MSGERPVVSLDTNILIYAIDLDSGEKNRQARAVLAAAARKEGMLTLQVLAEFFHATTRKGLLDTGRAQGFIEDWRAVFPVASASEQALLAAIDLVRRHRWSFWDAMLVATAAEAGCTVMYSEDMRPGPSVSGVEIVNPFVGHAAGDVAGLPGL